MKCAITITELESDKWKIVIAARVLKKGRPEAVNVGHLYARNLIGAFAKAAYMQAQFENNFYAIEIKQWKLKHPDLVWIE